MKKTVRLLAVLLVFWARSAWALDMEYYTYGGFDLMVQAFNLVALIFSDIDYKSLLPAFAILGLIMGAAGWLAGEFSGTKQMPLGWALKVAVGIVIYIGLFVPTGRVAIYDATLNKTQTIGGVPNGIVLVAGFLNKIERVVVQICDTAAGPASSYSGNAGGIGFDLLAGMNNAQDIYATMSMEEYMDKCVIFETMRPGTTIGFGDFTGNNTDFLTTLAQAVNPAVFTVYYEASNPGGSPITCTDAWNKLRPIFSAPGAYDNALNKTCSNAFLNGSDPAQLQACKQIIENTVNYSTGSSYTYNTILKQSQLSKMLYHTFTGDAQHSAALQANRTVTSGGFGAGIAMSEWVPIIKSILNALAICLIPFLALLLPTPIVGKVLSAMVGFFVFLTVWGACDAVIHTAGMVYASNTFQKIGPNNLGILAMAAMPSLGAKTLAMFGYIRSAGLMLAAVFTQLLIKFGGSALAHLAGGLMSSAGQGGQAAGKMLTPEGRSAEQQELIRSAAEMRVESQEKFSGRGAAMAYEEERRIKGLENAQRAAQKAEGMGLVARGTSESLGGIASMSTGQQHLTTDHGTFDAFIGPDGQANMLDGAGRNEFGTKVTFGSDGHGVGTRTDVTSGANTLDYRLNGHGGADLTSWQSKTLDGLKLGQTNRDILTTGAAHSFARNKATESLLSESLNSGGNDATSRAQSEAYKKAFSTSFDKNTGEGSDFAKHANWEELSQVRGFIQASGGFQAFGNGVKVGAEGNFSTTGKDGHQHSMKVSESTANALRDAVEHAHSDAFNTTRSTAEGAAWLSSIAQKSGNTEAFTQINEARNMSMAQQAYGENLNVPFLKHYASTHFDHSTTPEALDRAADFLSSRITDGGDKGKAYVDSAYKDFLHSYSSPTSAEGNWGGQATSDAVPGASAAMGRAREQTNHVNAASYRDKKMLAVGRLRHKMRKPNSTEKATDIADGQAKRAAEYHKGVESDGSVVNMGVNAASELGGKAKKNIEENDKIQATKTPDYPNYPF